MTDTALITIVDDHAMFRNGLSMLINMLGGYKVINSAANGNDFINQLNPHLLPDIVLLDIYMPTMNGFETAAWIHRHHPAIKVLTLSTMNAENDILKMIVHGANGYILKDAEPSDIKIAFEMLLSCGYFYSHTINPVIPAYITGLNDSTNQQTTLPFITSFEKQLLTQACSEKSYHQVAELMNIPEKELTDYLNEIYKKLNVTNRAGLALFAAGANLL